MPPAAAGRVTAAATPATAIATALSAKTEGPPAAWSSSPRVITYPAAGEILVRSVRGVLESLICAFPAQVCLGAAGLVGVFGGQPAVHRFDLLVRLARW